ncbi:MAG: nitroreductase family deazaflavin-dependent oxidoreductase [Acidimicrobiales bacterium]
MSDRNEFNNKVIAEFRANGGKCGPPFEGAPMILVSHKGAKTGTVRTAPLVYSTDGDRFVIIASKAGADTNPDWYHNMKANPEVEVEVGTETFTARVSEADGAERQRLYDAQAEQMANFKEYAAKTTRQIPVLVLTRA